MLEEYGMAGDFWSISPALIFLVMLAFIYKLYTSNRELQQEIIVKDRRIEELRRRMTDATKPKPVDDPRLAQEVEKVNAFNQEGAGKHRKEKMELRYWKMLEQKVEDGDGEDVIGAELAVLDTERSKLKASIDLSKKKYHKRQIDEESFREIMRDYQRKLIEVEAGIEALKKKQKSDIKK